MNHIELGTVGENIAANYLSKLGYTIADRNYRWKKGELDLVCRDDRMLVVVEVKTRQTNAYGEPYTAVTRSKQKQLVMIADHYVKQKALDLEVRFDVLSIVTNSYETKIEHIKGAFLPSW